MNEIILLSIGSTRAGYACSKPFLLPNHICLPRIVVIQNKTASVRMGPQTSHFDTRVSVNYQPISDVLDVWGSTTVPIGSVTGS